MSIFGFAENICEKRRSYFVRKSFHMLHWIWPSPPLDWSYKCISLTVWLCGGGRYEAFKITWRPRPSLYSIIISPQWWVSMLFYLSSRYRTMRWADFNVGIPTKVGRRRWPEDNDTCLKRSIVYRLLFVLEYENLFVHTEIDVLRLILWYDGLCRAALPTILYSALRGSWGLTSLMYKKCLNWMSAFYKIMEMGEKGIATSARGWTIQSHISPAPPSLYER